MANKYLDTTFVDKAIKFAVDAHSNTERRGKGFPYVIHVMEAMEIVASITNDPEIIAAAALHDTIEDTSVTFEDLRREFGDRVARLVADESDKFMEGVSEADSWRERKEAAISRIASAPYDSKIVAMGDKLSNMRAIYMDYRTKGDDLWNIFHVKEKTEHEWHYRGLAISLVDLSYTFAYKEFVSLITAVFGYEKYRFEDISLDDYVESGGSFMATSYDHKTERKMIKLYNPTIGPFVPEDEITHAESVWELGIVSPKPLRLVRDGDRYGIEFERIVNKRSYARAISQEPENLEMYARKFARYCKQLHATDCRTDFFSDGAELAKKDVMLSCHFTDDEKAKVVAFIDSVPKMTTCLHGDMHIGNILTTGTADYWIDMGDFSYGNPMFDIGMLYLACKCNPDEMTQNLYHLTNEQMGKVWDIFVKEYYGDMTAAEKDSLEKQAGKFASLRYIHFSNFHGIPPEAVEMARAFLLN